MEETESESSQMETSPDKSVTEDDEMVTGNSETSEVLISPNSLSTSDKSSMQVKDKAEKRKLEQTHTDDGASPLKERRLGPTGLTKTQKRKRCRRRARIRNKQKLAEAAQEVTVTASGEAPGVAQEKPPQNQIATENQSSPTFADKLPSKKAKRHRKKKKIGIVSEKPNGDGSVQPVDTSVDPEVIPGEKKRRRWRKKKLANGSVAESTGDSIPQRVRESGDVRQSATSGELQVSKESKPEVKTAKIKGELAGECPQGETSPDQSVTLVVKVSANKRWKSESSLAETSPEKSLSEDVESPVKKRKMKENESECSQMEMSVDESVTEDVKSKKKRRKQRKKKNAMVTGNSETPEVLISPNCVSNPDKSLMEVEEKAEMIKLEQTHTDDGASTPKERLTKRLTKTQKRRRCRRRARIRNKQKLAEAAQEVTETASGEAPGVAQEKPPQNQIATVNQSSPTFTDKLPSEKAKHQRKKKKIGIASEKPDGEGPVQSVDTSVNPEVLPGEKNKRRRWRKKKLANGSVAESTGDAIPQRVWESGDVRQSARSEKLQVSKESKRQVKADKLKGNLSGKSVILKRSVADKRLNKLKKTIVSIARSQSEFLLQLTRRCLCVQ